MSRVNDTGHVKGRLRPLEKISFVLELYKLNEKVSSSLDNRRPVHLWKIVSFFDTGSRAILAKVFHKVELRCSCWFRFFTFLNQGCNFVFANCLVILVSELTVS